MTISTGSYVYLNYSSTTRPGLRAGLTGLLPKSMKSLCMEFNYATSGNNSQSVKVYVSRGLQRTDVLLLDLGHVNTGGKWRTVRFNKCVNFRYVSGQLMF